MIARSLHFQRRINQDLTNYGSLALKEYEASWLQDEARSHSFGLLVWFLTFASTGAMIPFSGSGSNGGRNECGLLPRRLRKGPQVTTCEDFWPDQVLNFVYSCLEEAFWKAAFARGKSSHHEVKP